MKPMLFPLEQGLTEKEQAELQTAKLGLENNKKMKKVSEREQSMDGRVCLECGLSEERIRQPSIQGAANLPEKKFGF